MFSPQLIFIWQYSLSITQVIKRSVNSDYPMLSAVIVDASFLRPNAPAAHTCTIRNYYYTFYPRQLSAAWLPVTRLFIRVRELYRTEAKHVPEISWSPELWSGVFYFLFFNSRQKRGRLKGERAALGNKPKTSHVIRGSQSIMISTCWTRDPIFYP